MLEQNAIVAEQMRELMVELESKTEESKNKRAGKINA